MKAFSVSVPIRASASTIWSILTDAAKYPAWNSTVNKVEGRIALREKVTVHAKISPGRAFPVKVTQFEPGKRMVWTGGMPLGLFKGERTFTLTDRGDSTTEFQMKEHFSGLLAPLIERSIPDLQPAFNEFAADLKRQAESGV